MFLQILKIIGGIATIITGVVSVFWPLKVPGFTGLEPNGGRGITEIRTILGALFVGLGAAVLFYRSPEAYMILGVTYLAMALVKQYWMKQFGYSTLLGLKLLMLRAI